MRAAIAAALVVAALFGLWWAVYAPADDALVVYVAVDAVHAEAVLRQFEAETGIAVAVHFDSEATKSLGLIQKIERERAAPRADVFWNNELLGTVALARQGLLAPHKGTGWERCPPQYRDAGGLWAGLGARLRVWIAHQETVPDRAALDAAAARLDAVDPGGPAEELGRMAVAKPLYGTTLTHYSALWHLRGPAWLKSWHADARRRGLKEVNGNAITRNLVAEGACDLAWTDTDDAFGALDQGKPVWMAPVEIDGQTIAIPNTVAMIEGCRHPEKARRLIDWLLSEKAELLLANSSSRQVPLGPVDESKLPPEVAALRPGVARGMPLADLVEARAACLAWLEDLYK